MICLCLGSRVEGLAFTRRVQELKEWSWRLNMLQADCLLVPERPLLLYFNIQKSERFPDACKPSVFDNWDP